MRAIVAFIALAITAPTVRAEPILIQVADYHGPADSPFVPSQFEDFEDREFNIPGLTVGGGLNALYPPRVYPPSGITSAVEEDGHSFGAIVETIGLTLPSKNRSELQFFFDESVPLDARLYFGFALTRIPSGATFTVDVYDDNESLVKRFKMEIDALDNPTFFAVISDDPMASVNVRSNTIGMPSFFQIDHLQYGVPEPHSVVLAVLGFVGIVAFRSRRFRNL
jgi:hypothetical protein